MERVPGVELAGYLSSAVGVGEAARRYVGALRSVGVPVSERDVPLPGRDSVQAEFPSDPPAPTDAVAFNLLCLNPEQMVPYLDGPDAPLHSDRMTIGIWSWEVDVLPPGWRCTWTEKTFSTTSCCITAISASNIVNPSFWYSTSGFTCA